MIEFLDVAVEPTTKSFEETTGISPVLFGVVIGIIVIALAAAFIINKNKGNN